jgi:pSer/pThr/pTyr-binding forkhead associated (FHA) protein
MSKLVLYLPDGTTLDIPLDRERMTIGRRADNEVCLPNLAVSGEHAVVVTILADSFLEDLGSTNGTLVNGKAIAKHFLRDRDEIDIGKHKLVYCADDDVVLEPAVVRGMARVAERISGGRVEMAKPPATSDRQAPSIADDVARRYGQATSGNEPRVPDADSATWERVTAPSISPAASIKVLTGVNAGTSMPLTKAETTIGRPGVQVAAIVKNGDAFVLKQIEGERAPVVNNQPVAADGAELAHGDVIELAGRKIEFVSADAGRVIEDSSALSASEKTKA